MSVTVRMNAQIKTAIAVIGPEAWTTIEYTDAFFDETTGRWVSRAEVAEMGFTAFAGQKRSERVPGRLVVRRIPDFNADRRPPGQGTLFDVWRFHAFFTTADPVVLDTIAADKTHRGTRDHRTGPRRPQELGPGTPALRCVHRQRRLAGALGDRVHPHPRRRQPHRAEPDESDHGDDPPEADRGAGTGRDLGTSGHPAPPPGVAVGDRLDGAVRPGQRPAASPRGLTTTRQPLLDPRTTVEHPDSKVRPTITSSTTSPDGNPIRRAPSSHRWIRAKPRSTCVSPRHICSVFNRHRHKAPWSIGAGTEYDGLVASTHGAPAGPAMCRRRVKTDPQTAVEN